MIYPDGTRMKGLWEKGKLVKEERERERDREREKEKDKEKLNEKEKENRDYVISN